MSSFSFRSFFVCFSFRTAFWWMSLASLRFLPHKQKWHEDNCTSTKNTFLRRVTFIHANALDLRTRLFLTLPWCWIVYGYYYRVGMWPLKRSIRRHFQPVVLTNFSVFFMTFIINLFVYLLALSSYRFLRSQKWSLLLSLPV